MLFSCGFTFKLRYDNLPEKPIRWNAMFYTNTPVKLVDCFTQNTQSELLIVEGDSAAQAVVRMRNGQAQAVLPMQGKPMNTLAISQKKLLQSPLFKALIDAIGAGVGESFKLEKLRYQRIVLLMDPDADGIHCGALMLLFFYRWMRPLLETGKVILVRPPVGEVTDTQTGEVQYAYTEPEFFKLLSGAENGHLQTVKYRGLAGIPQTFLEISCIAPQTRRAIVMGVQDAEIAQQVFAANA